ncbi:MAG TPA: nucleoside-diphosphate sugar epimerase/dehydratase, partial [Micropruina sp.]|nr:nucleoside-diphosphate sugar epimerase/dehydratase [Micropruina sp.]
MRLTASTAIEGMSRRRHFWLLVFDSTVWILAVAFAALARMDFQFASVRWSPTMLIAGITVVLFAIVAWVTRLHDGRSPLGSLDETIRLAAAALCVGVAVYLANLLFLQLVPRSVPLIATVCAVVAMAWGRALVRAIRENSTIGDPAGRGQPVLVIGAGSGGRQLVKAMRRDPASRWSPVGILDDDRHLRHLRIDGVPVIGPISELADAAVRSDASTVVVAIPSAPAELLREISATATDAGLTVKVLPGVNELLGGRVGIQDVRDINIPDLLGRRQIDTDVASIAGYLTGQRVLVTGAGGSIGSELCRQISRWNPAHLIMLDRDESALHAVQLSIEGRALLDSHDIVLADIRDRERIIELFRERRPQVVFHAAALKHLPMLEQYPAEAVKTNIWGTQTVLEAAEAANVERFVNISTDKAANPTSVLGYSKRVAEGLTAAMAERASGTYLSVRFGNVLGSRGSVLTAFAAQIAAGGPVTVTHPDVTRYFMTVDEAVQLVIQAAVLGQDGEALVLDMGKPVWIDAMARQLIELAHKPIQIEYTGLRVGEKLHEELLAPDEPDNRPNHPLVSQVRVPQVQSGALHLRTTLQDTQQAIEQLRLLCEAMKFHLSRPLEA